MKKGICIVFSLLVLILAACQNPGMNDALVIIGGGIKPSNEDVASAIRYTTLTKHVLESVETSGKYTGLEVSVASEDPRTASSSGIMLMSDPATDSKFYADVRFTGYSAGLDTSVIRSIDSGRLLYIFTYSGTSISDYEIITLESLSIRSRGTASYSAEIAVGNASISASATISLSAEGSLSISSISIESVGLPSTGTVSINGDSMEMDEVVVPEYGMQLGFSGGAGTEEDPVLINSTADMQNLASLVGSNDFTDKHFALMTSIDLGSEWMPIGNGKRSGGDMSSDSTPFTGVFDGRDNTITINGFAAVEEGQGVGIFGFVSGESAEIKNLRVQASVDYQESMEIADNAGIIVGILNEGASVTGCEILEGSTFKTKGLAGGIVGRILRKGTIDSCVNYADITAAEDKVAGIVAAAYYNQERSHEPTIFINNCDNYGDITGPYYVGGISGLVQGAKITDCHNHGAISALYAVGGVIGSVEFGNEIDGLSNTGVITVSKNNENDSNPNSIGGVIGQVVAADENTTIADVRNEIATAFVLNADGEYVYIGGVIGQLEGAQVTAAYNSSSIPSAPDGKVSTRVGGLAGMVYGGAAISGENSGSVSGSKYVGGITGYLSDGSINADNRGSVTAQRIAGGIAGDVENAAGEESSITGSDNSGAIIVNGLEGSNEYSHVGGIVGLVEGAGKATVSSSNNTGAFQLTNPIGYIGGIAGYIKESTVKIEDCSNSQDIAAEVSSVGGIAGGIDGLEAESITISGCTNNGDLSGKDMVGGIAGYAYHVTIEDSKNEGSSISGHIYLGGIAGSASSGVVISGCTNSADIHATCTKADNAADEITPYSCARYVGGITGYAGYHSKYNTGNGSTEISPINEFSNSSSSGDITLSRTGGTYIQIGGLFGSVMRYGIFENCDFSGTISGNVDDSNKGIVGAVYQTEADYNVENAKLEFTGCDCPDGMDSNIPEEAIIN